MRVGIVILMFLLIFSRQTPEVPWRQMAGTRDRLTHMYFEVDLDVIWGIVSRELPRLIT
jgi:uncharacterized protein with HEPN domain